MNEHKITPDQVDKIEHALEERKKADDRRAEQQEKQTPADFDRRSTESDRRKQ